jgi:hypothetical protein
MEVTGVLLAVCTRHLDVTSLRGEEAAVGMSGRGVAAVGTSGRGGVAVVVSPL